MHEHVHKNKKHTAAALEDNYVLFRLQSLHAWTHMLQQDCSLQCRESKNHHLTIYLSQSITLNVALYPSNSFDICELSALMLCY